MRIPSSPDKRYLGGADWCIAALNHGTLANTGRAASFRVAVMLDGQPDRAALAEKFRAYCRRFPVLWGGPARCWCLAPYWTLPEPPADQTPLVKQMTLPDAQPETFWRLLESLANAQAELRDCRTALHIVTQGDARCALVFSFDHRLFDAAGAEGFIGLFFDDLANPSAAGSFPAARPTAPAQLDQWRRRFAGGQKLNRAMRRLVPQSAAGLPLPGDSRQRPFRMRVIPFSAEESRRIQEQAFATAGYLMLMPYVLATAAAVFQPFFLARTPAEASFVVSVSTNRSRPEAERSAPLFFNNLSFLFFGFPVAGAADRDALARVIRDQMIAQVQEGLPEAIEDANLLMRILPARWFWRFMQAFAGRRQSSFALTCLGKPAWKTPAVLGARILSHLHFPVIPAPPGIGVVVGQSTDGYYAVLSYLEGVLPEAEIEAFCAAFRTRLAGGSA